MGVARRNQKFMDFTTGILLPLILGGVGIFTILRLVRKIQARAYLKDAVVVITGATSGLGKECAKAFHAAGSQLVLCGRSGERLRDVLRELSAAADPLKNAHKHHVVVFDLSDINAVVSAAKEILSCVDHVDILINNAGISYRGTITETVIEVDRKVMETNYFGPVALTKALLPAMIKRRKGHIVTISSVQGKISIPFRSAYAASKHATQAFFDCLRAEVERFNIEVTVVCPGYIQTNLSLNAVTSDGSQYGVMDKSTREGKTAADVARLVLDAVGERRKEVLPGVGFLPALAVYLRPLCPTVFFTLMARRARKEKKEKES
ncbi:dehydrogenase/reductase SDR family member 7B isoform X1 [Notechis scutatus]|uniref:Dehydrogenase/reductase SDR family member 7B n=2 Tax=Notechis scutatus TaxID=8663 RepID=A0A6J1VCK7_9SAUR|nr:dehydrogenase/reductase SDR family member 7B isoform X1 [Notechis scutatus]XP_026540901.1 dehydrogenase/reductase SDR family member 7B isoform X1 [Notechis scutatus]